MLATLTPVTRSQRTASAQRLRQAIRPLASLLRQLEQVLSELSDAQYTQKPVGVVESSVGGHVRHCLDHVRTLLAALETGTIDYDRRQRGTAVETSRCSALAEINEVLSMLEALQGDIIDRELALSALLTSGDEPATLRTTFGREIAYTLSHTIHHNALIGAMVKTLGGSLPERFGYAPSTVSHLNQQCAR